MHLNVKLRRTAILNQSDIYTAGDSVRWSWKHYALTFSYPAFNWIYSMFQFTW